MKKRKHPRGWSDEELSILGREWKNGKPIRLWMDLLPNRSERAINTYGLNLFGARGNTHVAGASVSWRRICQVLADGAMLTPQQIADRAGISLTQAYCELRQHRGTAIHIGGYEPRAFESGYQAALWKLGPGKNKKRPKPMSHAERARRRWRKLKEERPDYIAARTAKMRLKYAEKNGKLIRRDVAASWI